MSDLSFLKSRLLVEQSTHFSLLSTPETTFYLGVDPTSDSLHIGHLLPLLTARRLLSLGHQAIILIGGATAAIGDPTGKTDARQVLDQSAIDSNSLALTRQIQKLLQPYLEQVLFVNNKDWFSSFHWLEFIREFGPHFSMNTLLKADSVTSRLANGMSFLEFNYQIMQAYDFLHLAKEYNCTLQLGGNDQWSNILGGMSLVHKKLNKDVHGLTVPLLVNSSGAKMGKTVSGAVYLDKSKTFAFDFFQFWRNVEDSQIKKLILMLTNMTIPELETFDDSGKALNDLKMYLATQMTLLVHGQETTDEVLAMVAKVFSTSKDVAIDPVNAMIIESPMGLLDLLVKADFAASKSAARQLVKSGAIHLNQKVVYDEKYMLTKEEFKNGFVLRKGKKNAREVCFK